MFTNPVPITVHRRSLALVVHYRAGDQEALASLLDELSGPVSAGATICSLVQWVIRALHERPVDPEAWLQDALMHLAAAEGDPQHAGGHSRHRYRVTVVGGAASHQFS